MKLEVNYITQDTIQDDSWGEYVLFASNLSKERREILSRKSMQILSEAALNSGHDSITVSSTIRYPIQQANAMYNNLSNGNRIRYAAPGRAVTAVYDEGVERNLNRETIINNMVTKITQLAKEGKRVSLHCVPEEVYNKLNVVDISLNNLSAEKFIESLTKNEKVVRILHAISSIKNTDIVQYLESEPCIHVEIDQL
ncbi:hypothetical protein QA601_18300 [Chitinispirillales bacterium ANBcel5]|uniref:hypothetical protein n=1 Tax=Cellulosispirillum alkaliphilum TaxID=3039283 RepID=UPI002A4FE598|nr:hypothetical protein [Chitinispirillales bacterium ANBcel5]